MSVVIYTKDDCIYCTRAKELLRRSHIPFEEMKLGIDYSRDDLRKVLLLSEGEKLTVPQIFIDNRPIGGYNELVELMIMEFE